MKKLILLVLAIGFLETLKAQTKGNLILYGYVQSVAGGKRPETGTDTDLPRSSGSGKNYYLYAVSASRIYPSELWIEGTRYGVTVKTITHTPVEHGDETNVGAPKQQLVPKTAKKVVQLLPLPGQPSKDESRTGKALAAKNEAVIVYKQNGKWYYNSLNKLSNLAGAAAQ